MAKPLITGSFFTIQFTNIWNAEYWNDECRDWKEESWRALVADQYELGIDTLICKQMALWTRPLFPDPNRKVGKLIKLGCADPAMVVLDEASKRGMKVWLGLGMWGRDSEIADYRGLNKPWPDQWFEWNTVLAESLMERYSDIESFAGFYLPLELSGDRKYAQTRFDEDHVELYQRWNKAIRPVIGNSKLLASPGILKPGDYSIVPMQLERLGVDVLAYQDLGGRCLNGETTDEDYQRIKQAGEAFELLADVHCKTGVGLWANCETFTRSFPSTWRADSPPGDIERIKYQLKVCSPHVEKVITWIYQGVWNKQTDLVNIGPPQAQKHYDDYVEYLRMAYPSHLQQK